VVDGAELLVTLPGQVDFAVGVAGLQTPGELGLLAFGQMLHTVAEEAADLVKRVVFVASVADGVLLDAAADLVNDLRPEADDVEGVEDRCRSWCHRSGSRSASGAGCDLAHLPIEGAG
jgi:hypothetical protein